MKIEVAPVSAMAWFVAIIIAFKYCGLGCQTTSMPPWLLQHALFGLLVELRKHWMLPP
jgi:hypothetical protein